jgi:hypothetical protein
MTLGDLISRLQTHFSPEERELPDGSAYPGRTESCIAAINAAMQFLFANHGPWTRRGTHGFLLHAPTTASVAATYGSTGIEFPEGWQDWFEGCACQIQGASTENRLRGIDEETGEITLELPHDGTTGTTTITLYHDSLTLPLEIGEVLAPVCIKGAAMLAPVPSVSHLPGYTVDSWEDYGMEDHRVTRFPSLPRIATTTGIPQRYCVDSHQHTPYSTPRFRLRIFPAPATASLLEARVRYAVPVFRLDSDTNSALPIPHDYAESVLVPVCEKHLTRSPFFRNDSARQGIEDAYAQAVTMLRTLNPQSAPGIRLRSGY